MLPSELPTPGADDNQWGSKLNAAIQEVADAFTAAMAAIEAERTATKVVPHQVTGVLPSTAFPVDVATTPQGTIRYPVRFAAPVTRFRVHIRNYSYADAAGYTGTVNLTGLWWGRARYNLDAELDGAFTAAPTSINGAAALTGTTEWVSGWIAVNADEATDYLLSIGWTTPGTGAAAKIAANWTRHWRTTSATDASQQAPALTGGEAGAPFDVWLECEIPAATPVVAFVGDSITVGNMHNVSFPVRYGQLHRVWPIVFGHYGGRLADWSILDARWTRYGTLSPDAAVLLCGINDIQTDATYTDLRVRVQEVITRMRFDLGAKRVFLATILPTNAEHTSGGRETIRGQYNSWLLDRFRMGVTGTIDMARVVASPSSASSLIAEYADSGGLHLNSSGTVQVANAIPHLTRG